MEILIKRIAKKSTYTIGKLYIDNKYFCDTLEDKDRGLKDTMSVEEILNIKVKHETAIPTGNYNVDITYSPRFKKQLPIILNVKGFDGIRFHSGNTDKDSSGCVLLGENKVIGKVIIKNTSGDRLVQISRSPLFLLFFYCFFKEKSESDKKINKEINQNFNQISC